MRKGLLSRLSMFRAVATLMLVALLVRAAVPTGWMIAPAEAGTGFTIELCSGRTVVLDPVSRKVTGLHGDEQPDEPSDSPAATAGTACSTRHYRSPTRTRAASLQLTLNP